MQKYVIILKDKTFFQTNWFMYENHWTDAFYCIVDTVTNRVTFDGLNWLEADEDHL